MSPFIKTDKFALRILDKAEREIFDKTVCYTLYEVSLSNMAEYYLAEAIMGDESELAVLGRDIDESKSLFLKISEMLVTPCTLLDVVSDNSKKDLIEL